MQPTPQSDRNADQKAYWNGPGGSRWIKRHESQEVLFAPVNKALFDRARVAPGERIIDIGCGCGATSIELARRTGSSGHVLGVDISEPMIACARELAPAGLPLAFAVADATVHPFESGRADLVFSRFGVMFFADPAPSFANIRKGLRPGARVAFACWREPRQNPWMIVALQEAYKHVPRLPEIGPDEPGPFAFAREDRVRGILRDAGFASIGMEPVDLTFDLGVGRGLDVAVEGALDVGPVSRAIEGQPVEVQSRVADSIRTAFAAIQKGSAIPLGGAIWITTAVNP